MSCRCFFTLAFIALANSSTCFATTYAFHQPVQYDSSPFGFSGTVSTDGSTGVLATTDFITSWSITVHTPSTTDGVASEVLTPSNSSVSLDLAGTPGLTVTPSAISMPPRGPLPLSTLTWTTASGETELQFTNRFTNQLGIGAGVTVFDHSERNSAHGVVSQDAPVATVIPEPATSWLIVVGGLALGCSYRPQPRRA